MKKKHSVLLSVAIASIVLVSCGKKAVPVAEVDTPVTEETTEEPEPLMVEETSEEVEVEEETADYSWVNSYVEYLRDVDVNEYDMAAMVYVDDDNIPEIALAGTGHSLGSLALTIGKDNTVKDHQFCNNYIYYMPRKDIMYNNNSGAGSVEDDISCINDGDWKTLFLGSYDNSNTAPVTEETLYTDFRIFEKGSFEEGERCSVSEKEYYDTMDAVFKERGYDEDVAKEVAFSYTLDDLIKELKQILAEKTGEEYEEAEPWKAVYRDKLYEVINGSEYLEYGGEGFPYSESGGALFGLEDITGDGIPELMVAFKLSGDRPIWKIYKFSNDGSCNPIGSMSFYDESSNKIYLDASLSFEGYEVYSVKDGELMLEMEIYEEDANIDEFRSGFNAGLEKYGIKGTDLTKENVDKEFGTGDGSEDRSNDKNSEINADSLLDGFLQGEIPAYRHDEYSGESPFMISDLPIDVDDAYSYHIGERIDLDNDGEKELVLECMDGSGGMYLDADTVSGKVNVFAEGEGTADRLSYTQYDGAIWIVHSDTSHQGRQIYNLDKYDGGDKIVDSFQLSAEYWDSPDDTYDENSDFKYRNKKISMKEFEKLRREIFNY